MQPSMAIMLVILPPAEQDMAVVAMVAVVQATEPVVETPAVQPEA